jgi:hypothetical protein
MSDTGGIDSPTSAQDPGDVAGIISKLSDKDPGEVATTIVHLEETTANSDSEVKSEIKSGLKEYISEGILFKNRADHIILGRSVFLGNFGSARAGREPGKPKVLWRDEQDRLAIVQLDVRTEDKQNTLNIFVMEEGKGHWCVRLWYNVKKDSS